MTLRSLLFAPANVARRVEKAIGLNVDALILDLEDACAETEKEAARQAAAEVLSRNLPKPVIIRINGTATTHTYRDLLAVMTSRTQAVMLPKAEDGNQVSAVCWLMSLLEREAGIDQGTVGLIPLIETARGVAQAYAIAGASPRVKALAFGAADYTLDVGATWTPDESELLFARQMLVNASRVAGIQPPFDTPWISLGDTQGFLSSVSRARALGFQGKLCIHPSQIDATNAAFMPSAEEVQRAQAIVSSFEAAKEGGSVAIRVDGNFVDYPVVERARRLLSAAQR